MFRERKLNECDTINDENDFDGIDDDDWKSPEDKDQFREVCEL